MIKVTNIRTGGEGEYCARPSSPLANPFVLNGDRTAACDSYEVWFHAQILNENPEVHKELNRLKEIHDRTGELSLLCFCAPLRCHCDTIKEYLDEKIQT